MTKNDMLLLIRVNDEIKRMWEILIDRSMSVEERYEKMGFDFPDVVR